jgi:hypothetical protein
MFHTAWKARVLGYGAGDGAAGAFTTSIATSRFIGRCCGPDVYLGSSYYKKMVSRGLRGHAGSISGALFPLEEVAAGHGPQLP